MDCESTCLRHVYKAAIYVRLSREDGDKEESNSITGQKELLHAFVQTKQDIRICAERVDDGYSGATFDRPGFQQMLSEIKTGAIDCVVVKDLSRFGRNYIETGRYIEQIFPFLGVRFIAVNDHYDSLERQSPTDSILIPFKNLINDAYCRDISVKIRSQLDVKRKKGDFIGAFAAYGYLKSPEDKNRLVIDDYAAAVVQEIFRRKIAGMSQQRIAQLLNTQGILPPAAYKRTIGLRYRTCFQTKEKACWTPLTVTRILQNELYIGTLTQGKSGSPNFRIKERRTLPKEEWICVKQNHEPIISAEQFETVQRLLLADMRVAPGKSDVYLLSGLLFCGDCGLGMVRKKVTRGGKSYAYYVCSQHKNEGTCSAHSVRADFVENAVTTLFQIWVAQSANISYDAASFGAASCGEISSDAALPQLYSTAFAPLRHSPAAADQTALITEGQNFHRRQNDSCKSSDQTVIWEKKQALEQCEKSITALYDDFKAGIVEAEDYAVIRRSYLEKYEKLQEMLVFLEGQGQCQCAGKEACEENGKTAAEKKQNKVEERDHLRSLAVQLLDRITVYENGRLAIRLRFRFV